MNMAWCEQGHMYDTDLQKNCPVCDKGPGRATNKGSRPRAQDRASAGGEDPDAGVSKAIGFQHGGQGRPAPPPAQDPGAAASLAHAMFVTSGEPHEADVSPCRSAFQRVTGWLVCIGGCEMGRDYRLRAGHNRIGRDLSMQVCIACDLKVSRFDHARLFHDLETSDTYLVPGTGQNGVYLNESVALQPVRLKAHDVITIGDTKLRFIPFCGEHFKWDGKSHEKTAAPPMHEAPAPQTDGYAAGPDTQRDDLDDPPPPSVDVF